MGRLFGLAPPPVEGCRVLELGCGDGGNLLPIAYALPGSECVGVDLSTAALERGRETIGALGLTNAELRHGDLAALPGDLGTFDYVLAHGVYSWVPAPARDGLMRACRELMRPDGVAYVSYNAYPGSHLRDMARRVMLFHIEGIQDPEERIREARRFARLVVAAGQDTEYSRVLREHAQRLLDHGDALLLHDTLADVSTPFYFHEFAEHAGRHGLQFLAEASLHESQLADLPQPVVTELESMLGDDVIRREQYLDFLRNRMFRQTLLCHAERTVERAIDPATLDGLAVAGDVSAEEPISLARGVAVRFEGPEESAMTASEPVVKAALAELGSRYPQAVPFGELLGLARRRVGADRAYAHTVLSESLLEGNVAGILELFAHEPPIAARAGDRPRSSAVAREQVRRENPVLTTLHHRSVRIEDPLPRALLALLDGSRPRDELAAALGDGASPAVVDEALARLARLGLLEQ